MIKYTFDIRCTVSGLLVRSVSFDTAQEALDALLEHCKNNSNVSMGYDGIEGPKYYGETGISWE